jgi:hypothetical protein
MMCVFMRMDVVVVVVVVDVCWCIIKHYYSISALLSSIIVNDNFDK